MLARNARASSSRVIARLSRCRNVAKLSSRRLATVVPNTAEESDLTEYFDHKPTSINNASSYSSHRPSGLFGQPALSSPESFRRLAQATTLRAQLLTERIVRARESRDELLSVVKNMDRLSDMLCSVIDLAELVRNAHPDPTWVETANDAYEQVCEVMNVLNTHVGLYEVRPLHFMSICTI